jgi:uncharacterized iron-regulated protein
LVTLKISMTSSLKYQLYFVVLLGLSTIVAACALITKPRAEPGSHADTMKTAHESCPKATGWFDPDEGVAIDSPALISSLAQRSVVLLGESHPSAEDHRWQLHTLAALFGRNPNMVIGFEMFPRSAQPVLDRWINGALDEQAFLDEVRWDEVWGYDAKLYLPLFHFARQNRIRMLAINVNRALVERVGDNGWANIPVAEREGVSDPAPVSDAYRHELAHVYLIKKSSDPHATDKEQAFDEFSEEQFNAILTDPDFQRFVEAQSTWDRAMAEGLAAGLKTSRATLAVGIMGSGHVAYGSGVTHQLVDLGVADVATAITISPPHGCGEMQTGVADAVFILPETTTREPAHPLLGVHITGSDAGVLIERVVPDSVAEAAGLKQGDVIVSAAGSQVTQSSELVRIVRRQAPGTWLPLTVRRGETLIEVIAKFPPPSAMNGVQPDQLFSLDASIGNG